MSRKQKTYTPVYVPRHVCLYFCEVDTMVFPQGKTERTLR